MIAGSDRVSVLLTAYLFQGLSPGELEPLARTAVVRHFGRGEYISHTGDPADSLYVVASGQVRDSVVTEDGEELVQAFFGPGMVIGEPGFFAAERNRVMALIAAEPSVVLILGREHLMPFLHAYPLALVRALEGLASVCRAQTVLIAALTRRSLRERVLLRLLELADASAQRTDGAAVTPRVSQSSLAAMVGVSRENVNRTLAGLISEGSVRIEAGRYVLVDPARLWAEASSGGPEIAKPNRGSQPHQLVVRPEAGHTV
jgi:CRP/FNR family cyclic AMP-dependent transcriptional regulator